MTVDELFAALDEIEKTCRGYSDNNFTVALEGPLKRFIKANGERESKELLRADPRWGEFVYRVKDRVLGLG